MSQQWPRVRNACEACHKRKQRCILPDSGGCCQACQQTGRQCYFLPRYRPGRPQRRPTDGVDDASGSAQASGSSTVASPPLPRLATPALPLDAGVSMSYTSTVEAAMTELDMYRESLNNAGGDNG